MAVAAPDYRQQLTAYRNRLIGLGTSRIPVEFFPGCPSSTPDTTLPFTETSSIKLDLTDLWISPSDSNIRVVPFFLLEGNATYPGGRIAVNCSNRSVRAQLTSGRTFSDFAGDATGSRIIETVCN